MEQRHPKVIEQQQNSSSQIRKAFLSYDHSNSVYLSYQYIYDLSQSCPLPHSNHFRNPNPSLVSNAMEVEVDTIFTFEAISERAAQILKHSHNSRHYVPAKFPSDGERASRETTPDSSEDGNLQSTSNSKLRFSFDRPPRSGLVFIFGSDPKRCDAYLGSRPEQVSAQHFLVYFNRHRQLVLQDVSKSGSFLVYNHKQGYHRRKDFVWVLFKNMDIIFAARAGAIFRLRVERDPAQRIEYLEHLERFLTVGQAIAQTPESKKLIGKHGLDIGNELYENAASSLPQGSLEEPIYHCIKELGSGGFGTVHKAFNVSTGYIYAAKKFARNQNFMREVNLLKSTSHVSVSSPTLETRSPSAN